MFRLQNPSHFPSSIQVSPSEKKIHLLHEPLQKRAHSKHAKWKGCSLTTAKHIGICTSCINL